MHLLCLIGPEKIFSSLIMQGKGFQQLSIQTRLMHKRCVRWIMCTLSTLLKWPLRMHQTTTKLRKSLQHLLCRSTWISTLFHFLGIIQHSFIQDRTSTPTFLELPLTSHLPLIQLWSNQSITAFQIKKCSPTLKPLQVRCQYYLNHPQNLSKPCHQNHLHLLSHLHHHSYPSLLHFSNSAKKQASYQES